MNRARAHRLDRRVERVGAAVFALVFPVMGVLLVLRVVSPPVALVSIGVWGVLVFVALRLGAPRLPVWVDEVVPDRNRPEPFDPDPIRRWRLRVAHPPENEGGSGGAVLLFVAMVLVPIYACFRTGETLWGFVLLGMFAAGIGLAILLARSPRPRRRIRA